MSRGRFWGMALAAALAMLVLLWGSGSGPALLGPPQDVDFIEFGLPQSQAPEGTSGGGLPPFEEGGEAPALGSEIRDLIVIAIFVLLGLLIYRLFRNAEDPPRETEESPVQVGELLASSAERAHTLALAEGDPRNAVVACWVALEDGAEAAGLRRSPAETSHEFTVRVLSTAQVPAEVIDDLAGLYRRARFSRHAVTEQERAQAVADLETIRTSLRTVRSPS